MTIPEITAESVRAGVDKQMSGRAEESPGRFESDTFDTADLEHNLRARALRGAGITLTAQAVKTALRLVSTAILARLLTPADFGLVAMVTVISGFVELFKDAGLATATIQRADITHSQISTLFWVNVALSTFVMLVFAALAPVLVWFYREPRLLHVTLALSVIMLFSGLANQHLAVLRRNMQFGRLAAIDVVSMAVGVVTAVLMAHSGFTYWSLVGMTAATAATYSTLTFSFSGWRPGPFVGGGGVRPMLAFGGSLTGFNILNYGIMNADNFLIGRFLGATPLGLYSRAYSLLQLPVFQIVNPLASVAIPAFSRRQSQPEQFRKYYCASVAAIAYLTLPIVVVSLVYAPEVVLLVLGEQWVSAVPIYRILALGGLALPVAYTSSWLYLSLGQARRLLAWAAYMAPVYVTAYAFGLACGPRGVAIAYAACSYFGAATVIISSCSFSPVSLQDVWRAARAPYLLMALLYTGLSVLRTHTGVWNEAVALGIGIVVALMGQLLWVVVCPSARRLVKVLLRQRNRRA